MLFERELIIIYLIRQLQLINERNLLIAERS